MANDLDKEYRTLMRSLHFDTGSMDYGILKRYTDAFSGLAGIQDTAVTIYDNYRSDHVFVSDCHRRLFGDGELEIHPDDLSYVMKNAIATARHVFHENRNISHIKSVREYRIRIGDSFRRVTESMRVLETDSLGNAWLVLSLLEISPNQQPPFTVNSQIVNTITGEVFSPLTGF